MNRRATNTGAQIVIWLGAAIVFGALVGAAIAIARTGWSDIIAARDVSGSWRFALLHRAQIDRWAGAGAVVAFALALSSIAWRVVAGGVAGSALGACLGGFLGAIAHRDAGAPVDWGALFGAIAGAAVGTVVGVVLGVIWHLHHLEAEPRRAGRRWYRHA